jgi:broad specificity phosphatase PhoE
VVSSQQPCIVYLVRHGATANNLAQPPILQGHAIDLGLSDKGRWQAEQTANFLANVKLTAVYSSPLLRAQETAEIIAGKNRPTLQTVPAFAEAKVGQWEGLSWPEIEEKHPEEYHRFMSDSAAHGYLGGENMHDVCQRVIPALEEVLSSNPGGRVLIVAHNIVNRVTLCHFLNKPLGEVRHLGQDNCAINVLRQKQGKTKLVTINAVFHLDDAWASEHES